MNIYCPRAPKSIQEQHGDIPNCRFCGSNHIDPCYGVTPPCFQVTVFVGFCEAIITANTKFRYQGSIDTSWAKVVREGAEQMMREAGVL